MIFKPHKVTSNLPSSSSLISFAAWMPSSLRLRSICLDRATAARSSADDAHPMLMTCWFVVSCWQWPFRNRDAVARLVLDAWRNTHPSSVQCSYLCVSIRFALFTRFGDLLFIYQSFFRVVLNFFISLFLQVRLASLFADPGVFMLNTSLNKQMFSFILLLSF